MKKVGLFCMLLSIFTLLFGCSSADGPMWQSLTYHVTSSVSTEGCHFILNRHSDGSMSIAGYCFVGEKEYGLMEAIPVSAEGTAAIEEMHIEKAASEKKTLFNVSDGMQTTVTLGYADGKERRVSLSVEEREQLKNLLCEELTGK